MQDAVRRAVLACGIPKRAPCHTFRDSFATHLQEDGSDIRTVIALGDSAARSKDTLGRVYEYFLSQFASAEGKKGGQFYTPSHVVRVLVEMLAPYTLGYRVPLEPAQGVLSCAAECQSSFRTIRRARVHLQEASTRGLGQSAP